MNALMWTLQLSQGCLDFVFRVRNFARRRLQQKSQFSTDSYESDSQATFYQRAVNRINSNSKLMRKFRRIYDYREILEHVDYSMGKKYLEAILSNEANILKQITEFKKNDLLGKPRTYYYEGVGRISPTTLRYIAVATDIRKIFGQEPFSKIAEIGGGYGGQAAILHKIGQVEQYFIFDLPEVQELIRKYLQSIGCPDSVYSKLGDGVSQEYDLVISNYAFSELPRELQNIYLSEVILKSRNGFMLMNSGKGNKTGRSDGKITLAELRSIIPNLQELPEVPLTSPDNYLLVWKS